MKNEVQLGHYIEHTALATIVSGQLVQMGSLHGVAVTDIAIGEVGSLCLVGVFTLPKLVASSADACTVGGPVYFSAGSVSGSDSGATRKLVGYSITAAAQATTTVQVRLLG